MELVAIALVLGFGMFAQWFAWRVRLPSIVFLLLIGMGIGPISEQLLGAPILDVEAFLGDLLFPVVSASVAIILFEGGMSLRFADIRGSGGVVRNLVTLGVVLTWLISSGAAFFLFGLSFGLSLLLGATVVVTGPTVIIPLLKQIRPTGRVGSILRWEGIIIDPIGAILAVLIFEEILLSETPFGAVLTLGKTLIIGAVIGWITAQIMIEAYRRYWVPDNLQNPMTVGFVIAAFTISNTLQPESGLLTVTLMGIILANQDRLDIRQIVEFKETLQVLLLSSLFILLAARISPEEFASLGWPIVLFVLLIIFVERPLAVWLSTWGSDLTWKERLFIAWMAPRGIVAAAVASIFAEELVHEGFEDAELLMPYTFAVIIGTVTTYSLTAGPLARYLGLSERNPQGVLIVGATRWIREVAQEIQKHGFRVLLTDTNKAHAERAKRAGLDVYHGNVLSEVAEDEINFGGLGRLLAMTPNSEVNALATEHYQDTFGRESVYELQRHESSEDRTGISKHLGGRRLFPANISYEDIQHRYRTSARVLTVTVQDADLLQQNIPDAILPLLVIPDDETLLVWKTEDEPRIQQGHKLIALVESEKYDDLVDSGAFEPVMADVKSQEDADASATTSILDDESA